MTKAASSPRTIANVLSLLRSKALTPQALIEETLARIAAYDQHIASFIHLDADGARRAAQQSFANMPLGGIPIAIKDIFDVAGMPTTGNSRSRPVQVPSKDAECVAELRASGVIALGKLAAWECGIGGTSFTLPWPPARNPWDLSRDPGGSSTGSGAALAAGFCLGSLGTDTGGSIREPASWCGVAGLKPTHGLVPTGGVLAASYSLDHVGPMARTSADCAMLMDCLAGREGSCTQPIGGDTDTLSIGVVDLDDEAALDLDPDVANALAGVERGLATRGHRLKRITLPPLSLFSAVCTLMASAEGLEIHRREVHEAPENYDPLTLERLLAGRLVAAADYSAAKNVRQKLRLTVAGAMADIDLLIMPTTRSTAPMLGGFDSHGGHPSLCRPWNVTGLPALSVRAGFDRRRLPIGMQIVGRAYSEALILRIGHTIERMHDGHDVWPDLQQLALSPQESAPLSEISKTEKTLDTIITEAAEAVQKADSL